MTMSEPMLATWQDDRQPIAVGAPNPLRGRERVRNMLRRDLVSACDLVAPLAVQPNERQPHDYPDLPTAVALRDVAVLAGDLWEHGIKALKLFCYITDKRADASAATEPDNLMVQAIRAVRSAVPDMVISTECCGCAWTASGECALLDDRDNVDLDATYELMARMAVLHAGAGADIIGPAAVLDGSVAAIRTALNQAGFQNVGVTPSVIFDSALFEPYKAAMRTNPGRGDRRGFQIDSCHIGQALDCARRWLDEGADCLLVQPAMMTVDLLTRLRSETNVPITSFSVSGEHDLFGDNVDVHIEFISQLRRAGADLVMTYDAMRLAAELSRAGQA